MEKSQVLSMKILSFFAVALGFPEDFFSQAHDLGYGDCLTTLRLLHYHDTTGKVVEPNSWRASAHTDFDCLTLLYQRDGGDGLEVCPGREAHTSFAQGDGWTSVPAQTGTITVNIGKCTKYLSITMRTTLIKQVICLWLGATTGSRACSIACECQESMTTRRHDRALREFSMSRQSVWHYH